MTRKLLGMAALLCLVALQSHAAARDKGEPTESGETTLTGRLQGTWEMVTVEIMGMKIDAPKGQELAFTFDGNKFIVHEKMRREEGTYKVDDTKTPKAIDLTAPMGQAMQMIKGIYQLDGDTLKIAFAPEGPNGNRPTAFDAKTTAVIVLKRKK
jgi:uncharacterized protein (TIGR03067 family)